MLGIAREHLHRGAQGALKEKKRFCLVIVWEGNPDPKLSSFQCRNSHQRVVFTRGCHGWPLRECGVTCSGDFHLGSSIPRELAALSGLPARGGGRRPPAGTCVPPLGPQPRWAASALVLPSDASSSRREARNVSPVPGRYGNKQKREAV